MKVELEKRGIILVDDDGQSVFSFTPLIHHVTFGVHGIEITDPFGPEKLLFTKLPGNPAAAKWWVFYPVHEDDKQKLTTLKRAVFDADVDYRQFTNYIRRRWTVQSTAAIADTKPLLDIRYEPRTLVLTTADGRRFTPVFTGVSIDILGGRRLQAHWDPEAFADVVSTNTDRIWSVVTHHPPTDTWSVEVIDDDGFLLPVASGIKIDRWHTLFSHQERRPTQVS